MAYDNSPKQHKLTANEKKSVRIRSEWALLVWLTQLGLSVVIPLAGFILLGVWLHSSLGQWTIWCGLVLGLISAGRGFWDALKAMEHMSAEQKIQEPPPISFHDHT